MTTGKFLWQDLTVDNAEEVRDFYCAVLGWKSENVPVQDYHDYNMINPADNNTVVAGICHRKGPNAALPPQWLNYVIVANLDESLKQCESLGGTIVDGPRPAGNSRFAVLRDPAGAYVGVMEEG